MARSDEMSGQPVLGIRTRRWQERLTFVVLALGIWPLVAVAVVGGYGFLVWMIQIVVGPPGPPSGGH